MQLLFDCFRWLHIIAGFAAILIFWLPIVTRKGGKVHTRSGWIYVYAMVAVSVSALYMAVYRIGFDPESTEDSIAFAWFLVFIALLSSACAWYGIRVLKYKRRKGKHRAAMDLVFPLLLLISGLGISIYGFVIDFALLKYFPLLGIFLGSTQLLYWRRSPQIKMHWIIEHIIGMLSCCIATITAFTVFGAPRLLELESVSLMVWFLPTVLIVPLIIGFTSYYKRKYNPSNTSIR